MGLSGACVKEEEAAIRLADGKKLAKAPITDKAFDIVRKNKANFEKRHEAVMKEMIMLHLAKMERSFNSRIDKESIPAATVPCGMACRRSSTTCSTARPTAGGMGADKSGKRGMPSIRTARSLATCRTGWARSLRTTALWTAVTGGCGGLFYHCFEQFGEQTPLLIFCGPKGNGKTLRTERDGSL